MVPQATCPIAHGQSAYVIDEIWLVKQTFLLHSDQKQQYNAITKQGIINKFIEHIVA